MNLKKVIDFLEKERLGILGIFLFIVAVSSIRTFEEAILFGYEAGKISYYYIFYYYHIISFYVAVFLGGITIMKFLTREKLLRVANLASIAFSIIIFPPLIDKYILHYSHPYTYIPKDSFIYFLTFMYNKIHGVSGPALALQLFFILVMSSIYVYLKTHSIAKAFANLVLMNVMTAIVSTPTINPLIEKISMGHLSQPIYMLRQICLSLIFVLILMRISRKNLLKSFLKSMGLPRAFHFILMGIIGMWIAGNKFDFSINYENSGNMGMFLTCILLLFFLWEYAMMINNFYDVEIDKITRKDRVSSSGMIPLKYVREIAIVFALISIALSFSLGYPQLFLSLLSIFLATIYSAPPIRLRNKLFSNSIIGIGSSICFLIGYFTPSYIEIDGSMHRIYPTLTSASLEIALLIFAALTAGSLVKDIDDYKGDLKSGVKNIFTIYGIEKGVKIVAVPVFLSFLVPLFLIHSIQDIAILFSSGFIASLLFVKTKSSKIVFIIYIISLLYVMWRYFS